MVSKRDVLDTRLIFLVRKIRALELIKNIHYVTEAHSGAAEVLQKD